MTEQPTPTPRPSQKPSNEFEALRKRLTEALSGVFTVDAGYVDEGGRMVLRGSRVAASDYDAIRARCEDAGTTPLMRDAADGKIELVILPSLARPLRQNKWLNAALLFAACATVFVVGSATADGSMDAGEGLLYMIGLMLPLAAHELGHYLVARRNGTPTSLPYFIPLPAAPGTFGAVMVQREPWKNRRILLEVGLAGPIAGFLVAAPLFVIGALLSHPATTPLPQGQATFLGDSIYTYLVGTLTHGMAWTDPNIIMLSNLGVGAWFALLITGLNLVPAGQLDGGHIAYALLGPRARFVSYAAIAIMLALAYFLSSPLMGWAVLLFLLGRDHPPVLDDTEPLGMRQIVLIVLGALLLLITFVPNPLSSG